MDVSQLATSPEHSAAQVRHFFESLKRAPDDEESKVPEVQQHYAPEFKQLLKRRKSKTGPATQVQAVPDVDTQR